MTALSGAAVELLAAVERGEVVRMPGGSTWSVKRGQFLTGIEELAGLVDVAPPPSPQMDRSYVLNVHGRAALAAAREAS